MGNEKPKRELISTAVKDALALKEAAVSAAKAQLVETLSPSIRQLVERELRGMVSETGFSESASCAPEGEASMADENKKEDGLELDMESSLSGMFPPMTEMEDDLPPKGGDMEEAEIPTLGEADDSAEEVDEEIEISEEALARVFASGLKTEAQVSKGFKDMSKYGELDDVVGDTGIIDTKKGETPWEKVEPPAKQDYTVKEVRNLVRQGIAENNALRESLEGAKVVIEGLKKKLHELNLFNSKVVHVNKLLGKTKLTNEQRKVVLEQLDKAKTIDEVKRQFETLSRTLAAAGVVSEGRKTKATATKATQGGGAKTEALNESAGHAASANNTFNRWKDLAGIKR